MLNVVGAAVIVVLLRRHTLTHLENCQEIVTNEMRQMNSTPTSFENKHPPEFLELFRKFHGTV